MTTPPIEGLTLRDYFAGIAMDRLSGIEVTTVHDVHPMVDYSDAARQAYAFADAMLKAREGDGF